MPWKDTNPVDQRRAFITHMLDNTFGSFADLCQHFSVSRKTGYRWRDRFLQFGFAGLQDRSRAPHNHGRAVPPHIVDLICQLRAQHKTWGPKKLRRLLEDSYPHLDFPAPSTIGSLLKKRGLTKPRKRRLRRESTSSPLSHAKQPNDVWTIDHKGQFKLGNGRYCYPLTVCDAYSRFILDCRACDSTSHEPAQQAMGRLFRRYGLPKAIRSDNGVPFCHPSAPAGISRLSVWFSKLGIAIQRIEPGKPQQNGRHERMHRTLKAEATKPPGCSFQAQQKLFDAFVDEFNNQRPHEALDFEVPAKLYQASSRPMTDPLEDWDYPTDWRVLKVRRNGDLKIYGGYVYISTVLSGERVAFKELTDQVCEVYYREIFLGELRRKPLEFRGLSVKGKRKKKKTK